MFERIEKLLKEKGWSANELARRIGSAAGTLSNWKRVGNIPSDKLRAVADVLETSVEYLRGETNVAHPGSRTPIQAAARESRGIPIIGRIKAGVPVWSGDAFSDEYVDTDDFGADAAMVVSGDSMIHAGIFDRDVVLLQKSDRAHRGQIVAAVKDDGFGFAELTLKYYEHDRIRGPILRAANPDYPDMPMADGFSIIGVFVGLLRYEEPPLRQVTSIEITQNELSEKWTTFANEAVAAGFDVDDLSNLLNMMKKAN